MVVETVSAGIAGEVEVEGAVLLKQHEDVLHLFAHQLELLVVREDWLTRRGQGVALDERT